MQQGKGLIKFFLVVMTLVCIMQYLFILPTRREESKAEKYAQSLAEKAPEGKYKEVLRTARANYLDSISSEEIFSIPLLKSFTYQELKSRQLGLGLDLKGGMSLILQVDLREFIRALSKDSKDPTFLEALKNATAAQTNANTDYVSLFANEFAKVKKNVSLAEIFGNNPILEEDINLNTTDNEVIALIRQKADETVSQTFRRLKERIDKLGVTQPNISLDPSRDLIIVELPGIENPQRARDFVTKAAKLEFWGTYRISDPGITQGFIKANDLLKKIKNYKEEETEKVISKIDTIFATNDLGNIDSSKIERIDTQYVNTNLLAQKGPLFDIFAMNGSSENAMSAQVVMGFADKNDKKRVDALLNIPEIKALFPNTLFLWSKTPSQDPVTRKFTKRYELYAIKKRLGEKAPLTGDHITNASADPDPNTGEVQVSLTMDQKGARAWGKFTTEAANNGNREVAIVLDDEVVSAPRVNEPILGGRTQITGNFDIQEGTDLANILQVGKLPAKTKIIQESLVGPTLGAENIAASMRALLIGSALVLIFMILYYSTGGLVSILTMFLNIFFIFGALASFGTVLTVPGFAGIVLTIGMAVDANVIIYERIREELLAGKSLKTAIADGYQHSYSAIIDANVTTILVAFVLFYFGIGPIKGFATILIIGVVSSLFTAVLVSRLIIEWWINRGGSISFWTGISKSAFSNLNIDWIGKRKIAYVISGAIILMGIASFFVRGFELGVDFQGGYSYTVDFNQDIDSQPIKEALNKSLAGAETIVKAVDSGKHLAITTNYMINDTGDHVAETVIAKLHQGINEAMGGNISLEEFKKPDGNGIHVIQSGKVGPTIADDIRTSSIYATIFALLCIFGYILLRFSKWQYSAGAVTALFHDVLVVLGIFSLFHGMLGFSLAIDQNFIAAILTVIGYSINDTVVVFDRVREFMNTYTGKTKEEIINLAINSTVSRTIITSLTTLFVVAVLLFFGGSSARGFAFALFIGIIVGTYSSVFIATPVMSDLSEELKAKVVKKKSFSRRAKA